MKKTKLSFTIEVPIYNSNIHFELGKINNIERYLKSIGVTEEQGPFNVSGITLNLYQYEKNEILVAVDEFFEYHLWYSLPILTHELVHATNMILMNNGITSDEIRDELFAYIQAYILENFMKTIKIS